MVFLGGPRQVGKTTLALQVLANKRGYLNWDIPEHRELILKNELPVVEMYAFDEIHKYRQWRNYLKGLYDSQVVNGAKKILVIGSARLDFYRYSGDSLQGRYHFLRLHPLSIAELGITSQKDFMSLLTLGGFPEPFLAGTKVDAARWSREYRTRLIREDLSSLERVQDIGTLELLVIRLPQLVGSPLSLNALREDLQVSHKTLTQWMDILERLYAVFRLAPFGAPRIRAVKKERKHYHLDWTLVKDIPKRFENMVAVHLLKWVNFLEDTRGENTELRYFRDTEGNEVDFVVVTDGQPVMFVEAKWDDTEVSKTLVYLKRKFPQAEAWQIHAAGIKDFQTRDGIRVAQAGTLLYKLV